MTKRGVINPATAAEYEAVLAAIDRWTDGWGPVEPAKRGLVRIVLRTIWRAGCHPTVLCPRKGRPEPPLPRVEGSEGSWVLVYERTKTGRLMRSKLLDEVVGELKAYLAAGRPLPYHVLKESLRQLNRLAGLAPPLTALRMRHRVGLEVSRRAGPGVAKSALGVSDRTLRHYTSLSDDLALEAASIVAFAPHNSRRGCD